MAVAVPLHDRPHLTAEEMVSLRHLVHHLGGYDRYLVAPGRSPVRLPGFGRKVFPDRYFGRVEAYRDLVLSARFYEAFSAYDYLLIYHLDALVFSSDLEAWCDLELDYIGAPWVETDPSPRFAGVGNSGFSLRNVPAALRVLRSPAYKMHPDAYWKKYHAQKPWYVRLVRLPWKQLKRLRRFNGVEWEVAHSTYNDDKFWARRAAHYDPSFRIAPVDVALSFAFECAPRFCYVRNGGCLPFGCHAWARYDRGFWEPHVMKGPTDFDRLCEEARVPIRER